MGRGIGCCLDLGSNNRVFHIVGHPPEPRTSGQTSASRDPITLQPTHPQVGQAVGTAVTGVGGHRGVAGLGLVQGRGGSGLVWAGRAHVWGGAPTWSLGVTCL